MFPDGRAAKLMSDIQFPCAHCGGAVREPLTLAAKRHRRDARAVIDAFRALEEGYPAEAARRGGTPEARPGCPGLRVAAVDSRRGRGDRARDVGRPLGPPRRGRGAASRERPLHGRPRARSARLACGDRPLAAGPCARDRGRVGGARPPGRPRRAHRRRRRLALAAVPGRDRVTGAALRGRRRHGPLRRRAARRGGREGSLPRRGCRRARRRGVRAARARRRAHGRGGDPRPQLPLRRRGRGARERRPGGARELPRAALHLPAGRVLRRRLRLGRARGTPHRVGQLPGALHPARGCCGGPRPPGRPAPASDAAGLGRVVRRQGGDPAVRRPRRSRGARARRPRPLDRGPGGAPRRELRRHRACHRAGGGLHGRGRARRAALRRPRGRRRVRPRSRAGDALPHARVAVRRLPRPERRRPGTAWL